jgi:hypothetical protein
VPLFTDNTLVLLRDFNAAVRSGCAPSCTVQSIYAAEFFGMNEVIHVNGIEEIAIFVLKNL